MVITILMMGVEIVAGWWFNSMALLADGWHMAIMIIGNNQRQTIENKQISTIENNEYSIFIKYIKVFFLIIWKVIL